jgi:hypothetical protein
MGAPGTGVRLIRVSVILRWYRLTSEEAFLVVKITSPISHMGRSALSPLFVRR